MRRIIIPLAIAGIFASPAVARGDSPTPVVAAPLPVHSLTYSMDCTGITITSSGYDEGTTGIWSIGDEPPRALALNGSGFTAWPVGRGDGWHQFVIMPLRDQSEYFADGIQCDAPVVEPTTEPEQVDIGIAAPGTTTPDNGPATAPVITPPPTAASLSVWLGVELAPPW